METQEKIRCIIEYMNIPDFEQIMSAKLLELEIALKPQIRHFAELKAKFKEMAGNEMKLLENEDGAPAPGAAAGEGAEPPAHYFELKRVKDPHSGWGQKWVVWEIHPEPDPADVNRVPETLLYELAQAMPGCETNPAKIEHRKILSSTSQRYFDIVFTKYSDAYAFGSIRRGSKKTGNDDKKDSRGNNMIKLNLDYRKLKKEDSYDELLRYLEAYPDIREHLLAYFYIMEKPRADKMNLNDE
ncbi:MAG: hypothetical protein NT166_17465 [Candidatus Aminicenantes bacterium]|nr:hypothetical protein [Candidatus Aminicenantes bacterium]